MQLHLSQRKRMMNNSAKISRPLWLIRSWLRLGTAGMLCLMLVACGGGGGGAAPSGDSSGTGNVAATGSCGIDEAAFTPGNRFEFGYAVYRGGETRTQVISLVNTGGVTFNGTTTVRTSGTTTQGSTVVNTNRTFQNAQSGQQVLYGNELDVAGLTLVTSYNPPLRRGLNPAIGNVDNYSGIQSSFSSAAGTSSAIVTSTYTATFTTVGLETITVPAGTLSVCRVNLDVRTPDGVSQQTQHTLANGNCRGQIVRLTDRITGLVVTEMSSARFNGASCL
jgi:hypothetical protein